MVEIKSITVLEHFETDNHIYGKYWVRVNDRQILVIRRNDEWVAFENFTSGTPLRECLVRIKKEFRDAILKALDDFLKNEKNRKALGLMGTDFEQFKVLTDENLRLIQENEKQQAEIERLLQKLQQPQAEAIKEFAERLKKHSYFDHKDQRKVVAEVIIDHYLKEMVGEQE